MRREAQTVHRSSFIASPCIKLLGAVIWAKGAIIVPLSLLDLSITLLTYSLTRRAGIAACLSKKRLEYPTDIITYYLLCGRDLLATSAFPS